MSFGQLVAAWCTPLGRPSLCSLPASCLLMAYFYVYAAARYWSSSLSACPHGPRSPNSNCRVGCCMLYQGTYFACAGSRRDSRMFNVENWCGKKAVLVLALAWAHGGLHLNLQGTLSRPHMPRLPLVWMRNYYLAGLLLYPRSRCSSPTCGVWHW